MAPILRPAAPSLILLRSFTSSARCAGRNHDFKAATKESNVPAYPYGPSLFYKQSNLGLYGLQKIRYGNMVSEKNEIKTRRYWRPNVHHKRLWSAYLGRMIRLRVTTRVMRTIDKSGGLDEYLLGEKAARVKELGIGGWALRWRIMQTDGAKERFRLQREALGLPAKEDEAFGLEGLTSEQTEDQVREFDEEMEKDDEIALEGELESGTILAGEGKFMEEDAPISAERTKP